MGVGTPVRSQFHATRTDPAMPADRALPFFPKLERARSGQSRFVQAQIRDGLRSLVIALLAAAQPALKFLQKFSWTRILDTRVGLELAE